MERLDSNLILNNMYNSTDPVRIEFTNVNGIVVTGATGAAGTSGTSGISPGLSASSGGTSSTIGITYKSINLDLDDGQFMSGYVHISQTAGGGVVTLGTSDRDDSSNSIMTLSPGTINISGLPSVPGAQNTLYIGTIGTYSNVLMISA